MLTSIVKPFLNSISKSKDFSEFVKLSKALPGVSIEFKISVNLKKINPGTLFGSGKIEFLYNNFVKNKIKLLLIDFELSPIQQRNLEKKFNLKILDRTGLILEIFSSRAISREGVLQVELAHLNYNKSRLVRSWTHLERQRGGMGFLGGPGETQIEADKRAINLRISKIKQNLLSIVKTRNIHRTSRKKKPVYTVALVGYTNSGKSTIFNRLTNSSSFIKDMLFATLDSKMKKVDIPFNNDLVLSDTVGFISNLPTQLVESFKATLEEVVNADCIIHVRDLGVSRDNKPILEIWNKIDLLNLSSSEKNKINSKKNVVLLSAKTGNGIEDLKKNLSIIFNISKFKEWIFVPFTKNIMRSWLYEKKLVLEEKMIINGYSILVYWNSLYKNKFYENINKKN